MIGDCVSNKFSKLCLEKTSYHIIYLFSLYRISVFPVVLLFLSHPIHNICVEDIRLARRRLPSCFNNIRFIVRNLSVNFNVSDLFYVCMLVCDDLNSTCENLCMYTL